MCIEIAIKLINLLARKLIQLAGIGVVDCAESQFQDRKFEFFFIYTGKRDIAYD